MSDKEYCIHQVVDTASDGKIVVQCVVCGKRTRTRTGRLRAACGVIVPHGPGSELRQLFRELAVRKKKGCGCDALAREMDALGIAGCRRERDPLAQKLREKAHLWGWTEKAAAAVAAVKQGWLFCLNWTDPFPGLVDEAIRRAETALRDSPTQPILPMLRDVKALDDPSLLNAAEDCS